MSNYNLEIMNYHNCNKMKEQKGFFFLILVEMAKNMQGICETPISRIIGEYACLHSLPYY